MTFVYVVVSFGDYDDCRGKHFERVFRTAEEAREWIDQQKPSTFMEYQMVQCSLDNDCVVTL